jgi:tRNA U34 2-thiouridine synthase MnmA/TrmU
VERLTENAAGSILRRPLARARGSALHKTVSAEVRPDGRGGAELRFAEPVWAPAPGQAAVVYDAADERVLGGGWIAARA